MQAKVNLAPVGRENLQIHVGLERARYIVSKVAWGEDVRPRQRRVEIYIV